MNLRLTLLLLVVVGGLAWLLLLTQRQPDGPAATPTSLLDGHGIGQADKLRWQLLAEAPVELQRTDQGFWITEPMRDLASRARLLALATAYDRATIEPAFGDRQVDDELLRQTGLLQPAATFTAIFAGGREVTVAIGGHGALGSDLFLRRDGRIYRGAEALYSALQVNLDDLRERQVFLNTEPTARQVEVEHELPTGAREKLVLQRQEQRWQLVAPIESRTEQGATQMFLQVLLGLRVEMWPASVLRPFERPADVVIDVAGDFGSEHVELWRIEGVYVGHQKTRDIHFQLSATQIADLFDSALQHLRARWLLPIADLNQQLARVVIDQGMQQPRLRLERRQGEVGFRLQEPVEAFADDTAIAELVQALNNCRVLQFVDGKPTDPQFGLVEGTLELAVQDDRAPVMTRLKIGADGVLGDTEISYAVRSDEPGQVVAIPQPVAKRLRRHWSEYVRTKVLGQPLPPVNRLLLARGQQQLVFSSDGSHWFRQDAAAPSPKLPNEDVAELVPELRDLRAVRVGLLQPPREPDWTVTLERQPGDPLLRLRVFERGKEQPLWLQPEGTAELLYEPRRDVSRALWALRALLPD